MTVTATPLTVEALRAAVAALGYEPVDAQVAGPDSRRVVKLRIDRTGGSTPGHGVTSEDCQRVSRSIERDLEAVGAVGPAWHLEVSSPGIERPVRFAEHWQRYVGRDVRYKLKGKPGASVGTIVSATESAVTLKMGGSEVELPLDAIREATLVVDWSSLETG